MRTYERTGLRTLGLTSSEQTPMKKTHTADEVTLDGEIPRHDSVYVSNANLKTQLHPTYFVIN